MKKLKDIRVHLNKLARMTANRLAKLQNLQNKEVVLKVNFNGGEDPHFELHKAEEIIINLRSEIDRLQGKLDELSKKKDNVAYDPFAGPIRVHGYFRSAGTDQN